MKGSLVVFRHLAQVDFIIFMVLLQIVLGIYMELVFIDMQIKKFDSDGTYLSTAGPANETRMSEVLKVIEKLTSSSDLTRGANFGLQDWASSATQRIKISSNGAAEINKSVSPKIMKNGSLITNPDYKGSSWYRPSGWNEFGQGYG